MAFLDKAIQLVTIRSFAYCLLAFILYRIVAQIIYYRYLHPLRDFPGPFWASVTRLWIGWHCWRQTELETEKALHEKYGPVLRITPTLLLVSDSSKLPLIYHRQANKTDHYVTGSFGITESVFNMKDHRMHARFRKHIAGPYSFTNIKKMEPLIDGQMQHWIGKMVERYESTGQSFDLCDWAVYMAYDVVSELGFGAAFGFVEAGNDVGGLIKGFHDGMALFGLLARFHPFTTWIKTTSLGKKMLVAKPEDKSGIGILMRYRDKLLDERLRQIEEGAKIDRVDLLQTFLNARTEDGQPLDMDYIRAEILLVLLAGADTTATTFQAMFFYIMSTPRVYDKVMHEIDAASQAGFLSDMAQFDEVVAHCPYYVACVRESMRLCPSAPNIFPRLVSEDGIDLYGRYAPPGTEITCNPWLLHRDKAFYGSDADHFRPERWLESESRTREMLKHNFAFGYGSRVCLGKDIAIMELYKGPLQFFRLFDAQLVDKTRAGRFIVHGGVGFWEDMQITVKGRSTKKFYEKTEDSNRSVIAERLLA
ncbi:cytochrome P450 [Exophiala viscosa]|uniref:Cytochrome P450 n=1 Tax=Exophiala viscosa TaxID=2486360 RepID=A0AAN6E0A6_9EURO|nr:cytochrome P450 [Exophiala viscosa]KAI1621233.1 cytochrome P450 [Exophiala viscosa]